MNNVDIEEVVDLMSRTSSAIVRITDTLEVNYNYYVAICGELDTFREIIARTPKLFSGWPADHVDSVYRMAMEEVCSLSPHDRLRWAIVEFSKRMVEDDRPASFFVAASIYLRLIIKTIEEFENQLFYE